MCERDGTATMTAEAFVIDEGERCQDPVLPDIVRAARAGDAAAFEEIMLLTERHVARIAWRILGDAEEVKEAMQESFLRCFRHLGRYDDKKNLFAWLSRIVVNVCRDQLRRRKRQRIFQPLDDGLPAATREPAADDDLIRRGELALLRRAIDALPPKERMAVILRDVEGLPTDEVASALGSSVSTVRVQLSRARMKLRQLIQQGRKP